MTYLDNGICAVKGKIEAKKASAWVRDALECVGLVVHEGKSVWLPSLSTAWLGFDLEQPRVPREGNWWWCLGY